MTRLLSLAALLLVGAVAPHPALAQAGGPADLVKQAVEAAGGAEALRGLKRISVTGEARHWEPEQSEVADGEPRFAGDSTFAVAWDIEKGAARTDWDRAIQYPARSHEVFSEIVTPALGYVADAKGNRPMSGIRVAAHLRELERTSPTLLAKALDATQGLRALPDQKLGGDMLPAVAFTDGPTTFTILFDPTTHLPAAIRTLDDDYVRGDSNYDLVLADWQPAGGVKVARSLTYKLDDREIARIVYKDVVANPALPAQAFDVPDAVRQAAKPPASGAVPYQWVLRRLNIARFTDSDALNYDAASSPGLKLVELAPTVQQVVGGSHNSLVVAMKDYLVVFDAPINEWQSRWTIDAAKAKYPGRPIRYLVQTHHHMDHAGGVRTYVAEGASIVVPSPDRAHFQKVFAAPHTVNPDEMQKDHKGASLIEIGGQMSLKDDTDELRIVQVRNPHVTGMLVGYVASAGLVWVTDLYSPGRDKEKSEGMMALVDGLTKAGITPARYAGGHGSSGSQADLDAILAAK